MQNTVRWLSFLLVLGNLLAPGAWAHKVNLFAYVEGETVYTESYFPDGKKVKKEKKEVLEANGTKILEGKTDAQGSFN